MTRVLAVAAAAGLAAAAHAQQVRAVPPIGAIAPAAPRIGSDNPIDDPGAPVEMLENPQLDRYLRAARKFLDAQNWVAAIQVLQDVIEGRTSEVVGGDEPSQPAAPEPEKPQAPRGTPGAPVVTRAGGRLAAADRTGEPPAAKPIQLDARNSVFSNDGRLYRPVRRLCHELLARMPDVGIELYRTTHEAAAAEMLQAAIAGGSTSALEEVANRYFVTLPGGRALALLGDRLMHEGRYRAAVQVLTDLLDVYPAQNRGQIGITEPWCRFKIAVCLALAGEQQAAHAAAEGLADAHRDESLRIAGELQAISDLPGNRLFSPGAPSSPNRSAVVSNDPGSWLTADTDAVVAMWQYRFRTPDPYREPKSSRNKDNAVFFEQGAAAVTMPFAGRYGPASWLAFADAPSGEAPRAWFLEHFRLRSADGASGLLFAQGDRADEPPAPQENQTRVRVAANDYALLRPIDDGERLYAVFGPQRGNGGEAVKQSELVAHHRDDLSRIWSSAQWPDGDSGLREVTFLAAPTVFGERLLLPALRRGDFTLECVDRGTGRPLWHTLLHRGGTTFSKPPGCPVIVQGGTALVATNAGCVAAVDAFAGDLRWIRRCERVDPLRRRARGRRPVNDGDVWRGQFVQEELPTFLPNDLHVVRDGVVVGACDSEMLLCLDIATGEANWMLDATTRHAPWGSPPKLRSIVGVIGDDVFALADNHLVAIDGVGGLVRWVRELPASSTPQHVGRGRGTVVGEYVVVPGSRELIVWSRDGAKMRRIALPVFDESREPLGGSFNVVSRGPWLAVGYQGGVEVFSSAPALRQLAAATTDPLRQCAYLVQAGDLDAAVARAVAAMRNGTVDGPRREAIGKQLLALVRERAQRELHTADLHAALAMLDAIDGLLTERGLRLDWHLARIELCKEAGDMRSHEVEQMRLYDYMEGKGG